MHTTISTEGRHVGIEVSDAVLHTRGEFCGNLHVTLQFDDPINTETVLKHLRIRLPDSDDLYDPIAHSEKAGGLEVIFSILDDPSLDPFPADKIPDMVELLWVEDNMPTRLGEVAVQTIAEEPDSEPESSDEPGGGSGCAGVLLAMLAVVCGLVLLTGLVGCPTKTATTGSSRNRVPSTGCRVERLDDAEQVVRHVTGSDAYVFKMDGDLVTCRFEILYRPDEDSEEALLYSASGNEALDFGEGELSVTDTHDNHHILAIAVPEYPPKSDDDIVFSFAVQRRSSDKAKGSSVGIEEESGYRESKKANEIFPESLLTYTGRTGSVGGPAQDRDLEPGQESVVVDHQHHWKEQNESEEGTTVRRDIVRYRVVVTCLEDGKLPDRDDWANDEGKDETTEEPSADERAVAAIEKLGGKVQTVRDRFDADAPARSIWLGGEFELDWLVVDLTDTQVTDAGLEHLTGLTRLRMLVLANTQVTDAGLAHLKGLTNLKSLSLAGMQVTDAGLVHLQGLTKLELLLLSNTQVTDGGLEHLKGMPSLRILYLSNTQMTGAGLVHLKGLTNLGQLHLGGTKVTGSGLEHVSGMTSLRCIGLDGTQVEDADLTHLKGLTNLRTLWFRNTQVTEAGVNDLKKSLPDCGIYR